MKKVSNGILMRVYALFGFFLMFGLLIVFRVMGIQLNQGYWAQKEVKERITFERVIADRGNILSEDGKLLATSLPFYRMVLDASFIDTVEMPGIKDSVYILASNLATRFGNTYIDSVQINDTLKIGIPRKDTMLYYNRIMQAVRKGDRHIYLTRKKINYKDLQIVKTWPILRKSRYKGGFYVEDLKNERFYPFGNLAKVTLGSIVQDTVPIRGIEFSFHQHLRGEDSYALMQEIIDGGKLPVNQYGQDAAVDGKDVVTTLNVTYQEILDRTLEWGVRRTGAKSGTAILMEVETGKIKGIANYPESFNHAIATRYEPGSTFKLVSATMALEDQMVDITDTVDTGDGTIQYDEQVITDAGKAFGIITLEEVFARSSNVGMSKIIKKAYQDDPQKFIDNLKKFGFGGPVISQIQGEPEPKMHTPGGELWTTASLPSMAIGYSVEVTPLQMATFYNAIANNGKLMRPWLVKEIREDSRVIESFEEEVMNESICSPETIKRVRQMMDAVVEEDYGTAYYALRKMPFPVAGKTGTAKKLKGKKYSNSYRSSFGGFFPANDPRYTLFVMVDEPTRGGYAGGAIAAPIFREVAKQVYPLERGLRTIAMDSAAIGNYPKPKLAFRESVEAIYKELNVPYQLAEDTAWVAAKVDTSGLVLKQFEPKEMVVPNLRGMSGRDAINILENMGLKVRMRGFGKVKSQSLLPGYKVGEQSLKEITLYLG